MTATLLTLLLLTPATDPSDLVGRVLRADGTPVPGAHVLIGSAAPRQGTSPVSPSCYPDCRKGADTDRDGHFRILAVDPRLVFNVLVVAEGYRPTYATKADPVRGPVEVRLTPFDPSTLDPKLVLRGVVLGPDGRPLAGARVTAPWVRAGSPSGPSFGTFDPVAVTNLRGEFVLTSKSPFDDASLSIQGDGVAPRVVPGCRPEVNPHLIRMTAGATVTGRLVRDGKPVAGAAVGLVQTHNRLEKTYVGAASIGTDADGRFILMNVHPDDTYYLYGLMGTMTGDGALAARVLHVGAEGTTTDVGDLTVVRGHRITGKVLLSDGKPVPPKTRLWLGRVNAHDSQEVELAPDGRFEVSALPTELYRLGTNIKDYRPSPKNHSVGGPQSPWLTGTINEDIDTLRILLEPHAH